MSVSHGYNTIGGIEYGGCGEDKRKEEVSHQLVKLMVYEDAHQLMLMRGVGIAMQQMHYSYKCMKAQKETKWVCIQLACSRRPREI